MAKPQCVTCAWEESNSARVDDSMTNVAWAREIGVNEASIRRHKVHAPTLAQSSGFVAPDGTDSLAASIDVPAEYVTSRGMSLRDPVTGSWQKVTWQPNRKALHDTLRYDDLRQALDGFTFTPRAIPANGGHTLVFNMADLQIGKACQRMGGTPETIARVRNSIQVMVDRLAATPPEELPEHIVIVDGGDPVENIFNTPEQIATNDLSLPEQIRVARRLFLEGIKALAPYSLSVYFVSVPSNHGRAKVGYKAAAGSVDADFGLEINHQLEDIVGENPYLGHVKFVRPEALHETATLEVSGTKLAVNHGHNSSGQKGHSRWWADQAHGRMPGWDADIMILNHYHNFGITQSGNGRWIIETSSSDPGSDWFANRTGQIATQGITVFETRDGQWFNPDVV